MDETVKDRILLFIKAESLSQNRFEEAVGLSHGYVNNLRSAPHGQDFAEDIRRLSEAKQRMADVRKRGYD